jgi:hypothetical protein
MTGPENWLKQMVGDWTFIFTTSDDSEYPGFTMTGSETVKPVGDTWVMAEQIGIGSDNSPSHSVLVIGQEPGTARFVGSHAGSAVAALFVYDGALDATGALALETEGPAMTEGRETDHYRDVFTYTGPDSREQSLQLLGTDGTWTEFARTRFLRR